MLTSNRDEKAIRPTEPPGIYNYGNHKIVFPRDKKAGGSWIALNDSGQLNCLLNGAFVAHSKQEHHRISRGKILLEFTGSKLSASEFFSGTELKKVEPFTIVSIEQSKGVVTELTEFIWDGREKHLVKHDKNQPRIWSSVTLYSENDRMMRNHWFDKFWHENKHNISPERIWDFHCGSHSSDKTVNLIMQREGGLKTVSITQVTAREGSMQMSYADLLNGAVKKIELTPYELIVPH